MKPIKSLIVSLCLAIALMFSGAFVSKVFAEDTDPQDTRSSQQPPPSPPPPPDIIRIILTVIGTVL